MPLDTRFTLLDKASQSDQAQLTLIFDDWEAMAGKSFDPGSGQSVPNNNQIQYQRNIRWAANHPWIEIVNLKDILDRAVNASNPQYDVDWVIDHGVQTALTIQTYEWLKHASEDSYHNWYYNNNAGFPGNEQSFYDLVPALLGGQGDYHGRFPGNEPWDDASANAKDLASGTVFLPSAKTHGDLNTPGTLMHDTWAAIASAPAGRLRSLAEWTYSSLIYETAWHEEDYGSTGDYQGTNFGTPWPVPDPTWDGVNSWALKLQNHVRSAGILADAAQWAEEVRTGALGGATQVEAIDLDQDGQEEYVLYNNRVYVCFERYGGRLIHGFAWVDAMNDAVQVLGAPVTNPSSVGEEEGLGTAANRCSTFKDMNAAYVDATFAVQTLPAENAVRFTSPDGLIVKKITLPNASGTLNAEYTNSTGGNHYVRIGASPNVYDLMMSGRDNLGAAQTGSEYSVTNSQGGYVKVLFGTASLNPAPADAGHENRNLALTEQIEVFGGASFDFSIELTSDGCSIDRGDFDGDCDIDTDDVVPFVAALLGSPITPGDETIADVNEDGTADGRDIADFTAAALTP